MFALTDSQNSLKQNEMANKQNFQSISQNKTIEKLTYLTIIYLPMSLTAVSNTPMAKAPTTCTN